MPTHVALLRGINLGGHNKVAMAELRELVGSLGHADVATYIQSGNVVFTSDQSDTAALAAALEQAIATSLGVPCRVVVLSREELAQVARDNPYTDEPNPRAVHAVFLSGEPGPRCRRTRGGRPADRRQAGQPRHRPDRRAHDLSAHPGRLRPQRPGRGAGEARPEEDRHGDRHGAQLGHGHQAARPMCDGLQRRPTWSAQMVDWRSRRTYRGVEPPSAAPANVLPA